WLRAGGDRVTCLADACCTAGEVVGLHVCGVASKFASACRSRRGVLSSVVLVVGVSGCSTFTPASPPGGLRRSSRDAAMLGTRHFRFGGAAAPWTSFWAPRAADLPSVLRQAAVAAVTTGELGSI